MAQGFFLIYTTTASSRGKHKDALLFSKLFTYILCQISACNCSIVGAVNSQCNNMTGLCSCHSHVTGKLCDRCEQNAFNYTSSGCTPCDCDIEGSTDLQCDLVSIHSLFFIR